MARDELTAVSAEEANRLMRAWQGEIESARNTLRLLLDDLERAAADGPPSWLIPPSTAERQRLRSERDAYRTALLLSNRRRRTVERIREDMERTWTPPSAPGDAAPDETPAPATNEKRNEGGER